jgi:hypothetical protein
LWNWWRRTRGKTIKKEKAKNRFFGKEGLSNRIYDLSRGVVLV